MKQKYKLWLWCICSPLVLLLLLYSLSGSLSTWLIQKELNNAGFHHVTISLQRPHFNTWHINSVSAEHAQARIRLQNITLHYTFNTLISGKLKQLLIEQCHIIWTAPTSASSSTKPFVLPTEIWPALPVAHIEIQNMVVQKAAQPNTIMHGQFSLNTQQLEAMFELPKRNASSMLLHIRLHKQGTLQANIFYQNEPDKNIFDIDMQWQKKQQQWQLQGSTQINVGQTLQSLQPWLNITSPIQHSTGHIQATWQLEIPSQQPASMFSGSVQTTGKLNLPAINHPLKNISLSTHSQTFCKAGVCRWTFSESNTLSLEWLNQGDTTPIAMHFPQALQGELHLQPQPTLFTLQSGSLRIKPFSNQLIQNKATLIKPQITLDYHDKAWRVQSAHATVELALLQWEQYLLHQQRFIVDLYTHPDHLSLKLSNQDIHLTTANLSLHSQLTTQIQLPHHKSWKTHHQSTTNLTVDLYSKTYQAEGAIQIDCTNLHCQWLLAEQAYVTYPFNGSQTPASLNFLSGLTGEATITPQNTTLNMHAENIMLHAPMLKPLRLQLNIEATTGSKSAQGKLQLQSQDGVFNLQADMQHHWQGKRGHAQLTLAPTHVANIHQLPMLFKAQQPWSITAGTYNINSTIQWQPKRPLQHHTNIQLQQLGGQVMETAFHGLNSNLTLHGDAQSIYSSAPSYLSIQNIGSRFPIQDFYTGITLDFPFASSPDVTLSSFQVSMLGGSITSPSIHLTYGQESNPFHLEISQIDLQQIMTLRKQEDLFASGILHGTLPLNWTKDGLTMADGTLSATTSGGIIRYLPDASIRQMAANNSNIQMLLDAFSDFRYQKLHTKLSYQADGQMYANVHVSGRNPDFQDGQTIHLNLNIEENILQLIRSLSLANRIGDAVDDRVQKSLQK